MDEEKYQEFLKTAPDNHFSNEFINFLRTNPANKVIEETENWLIIQNIKDPKDYTAFLITRLYEQEKFGDLPGLTLMWELNDKYKDREFKIKAPHKRSVKLFHVHLIQK